MSRLERDTRNNITSSPTGIEASKTRRTRHPAASASSPRPTRILGLGALYTDILLTLPSHPLEDTKTRATSKTTRIGGNLINTFTVLAASPTPVSLAFTGAVGTPSSTTCAPLPPPRRPSSDRTKPCHARS